MRSRGRSGILLFAIAVVVRVAYWLWTPRVSASDSAEFLNAAQAVTVGNWAQLREFPLHAVYAFLLAPGLWLGDVHAYVFVLHIALSAGTAVWMSAIARQMTADPLAPIAAGVIGVLYPNLIFWMPYILTDTPFVFLLLAFVWVVIDTVRQPDLRRIAATSITGVVLFFLRPVAVAVVAGGLIFVVAAAARRWQPTRARAIAVATVIVLAGMAVVPFAIARSRDVLFHVPTIGQTLWLSTTVVHGRQAELAAAATPASGRDLAEHDQYALKARLAIAFISGHPLRYLTMAVERFVSFWLPALYLDWSPRHRMVDLVTTTALVIAAGCAWLLGAKRDAWQIVVAFAMLLALESAFGQIDADARYRLPAEALLIIPAAVAISAVARRARESAAAPPETIV